ncbi:BamA/TamA family outer membrane protein [Iocasia frigidifontis]|uniref:BamA/TamA family outer membrane protein n=1 Tax=Iocasia fonsfrigidae TaxID=2682810 RepID=A0A8A7KCI4_9FIRM|nr:BamA/TamA family outer membrane protein [Iocasia fonsfrigidae]QTL96597.1 BamA/TamA family outer membrane protein [Iocasia fonsfrigidae]
MMIMWIIKKNIFKLILIFILMILVFTSNVNAAKNFMGIIQDIVGPKMKGNSGKIPFAGYVSEGGLMVGEFIYDFDLFDKNTKFYSANIVSLTTDIIVSYNQLRNYPLSDKWRLGGDLIFVKYTELEAGGIGNDTPDQEIPEEAVAALSKFVNLDQERQDVIVRVLKGKESKSQLTAEEAEIAVALAENKDRLNGYQSSAGWQGKAAVNLAYLLDKHHSIITEYTYQILDSEIRSYEYKADALSLAWEEEYVDDTNNPREGHKIITKVKKSLNLLSHDANNNWDYTKLTFDIHKYLPVFTNSTLALRFRTESISGEDRLDKDRTALKKLYTGDLDAEAYTCAPYFDMASLGDLNSMRGYYYNRFYDKNSSLYQVELRFPMEYLLSNLQGTVFASAGRVSDEFNTELFTEDMHYCYGLGLRYNFLGGVIIRGDIGFSKEGSQVRMNMGHSF